MPTPRPEQFIDSIDALLDYSDTAHTDAAAADRKAGEEQAWEEYAKIERLWVDFEKTGDVEIALQLCELTGLTIDELV